MEVDRGSITLPHLLCLTWGVPLTSPHHFLLYKWRCFAFVLVLSLQLKSLGTPFLLGKAESPRVTILAWLRLGLFAESINFIEQSRKSLLGYKSHTESIQIGTRRVGVLLWPPTAGIFQLVPHFRALQVSFSLEGDTSTVTNALWAKWTWIFLPRQEPISWEGGKPVFRNPKSVLCVMIRTLRTGVMVPSTHSGERTQQLPNTDSSEQGEV